MMVECALPIVSLRDELRCSSYPGATRSSMIRPNVTRFFVQLTMLVLNLSSSSPPCKNPGVFWHSCFIPEYGLHSYIQLTS